MSLQLLVASIFFLLSPLCCRPSFAAAAVDLLVLTNSGRCINLNAPEIRGSPPLLL